MLVQTCKTYILPRNTKEEGLDNILFKWPIEKMVRRFVFKDLEYSAPNVSL